MDDSPVQTALCVIGHPIAGNPAQFCISRILQSLEMDWQCLSFDVPPDSLQTAIAGIDVLHFAGALIAPPHQIAVAEMIRDQRSNCPLPYPALPYPAPNRPDPIASTASAAPTAPPPSESSPGTTANASTEKSIEKSTDKSNDTATKLSPWCDALARDSAGNWQPCNFIGESLLELIRLHEQQTGQTLDTCVFLGDQAAFESLMAPFIDCLPTNTLLLGATELVPWPTIANDITSPTAPPEPSAGLPQQTPTQAAPEDDDEATHSDADDATAPPNPLHRPLLLIRPLVAPPTRKGTAKPAANQAVVESLLEDLHSQSLTVYLAPPGAPWPIFRGQGETANARVTPLDLEVGRIAAAMQRWTGKNIDRNALAEAIEEYLEV